MIGKIIGVFVAILLIIAGAYYIISAQPNEDVYYSKVNFSTNENLDLKGDAQDSSHEIQEGDQWENDWYEEEGQDQSGGETSQSNLKVTITIHYEDGTTETLRNHHSHAGLLEVKRNNKIVESISYKSSFRLNPEHYTEYRLIEGAKLTWYITDDSYSSPQNPIYQGQKSVPVFPTAGGYQITGDWQLFAELDPQTMDVFQITSSTLAPGTYKLWLEFEFTHQVKFASTGDWQNPKHLSIQADYVLFEHIH